MPPEPIDQRWCGFTLGFFLIAITLFVAPMAMAADTGDTHKAPATVGEGLKTIGIGLGMGFAVGLAGLGTGIAQSRIGAAGVGAIAENQKLFGQALLFVALPETIVLFGFVISIMAWLKLG